MIDISFSKKNFECRNFFLNCTMDSRRLDWKLARFTGSNMVGIRDVTRGIEWSCEHASSAFIFTSTSTDQFSHASSEHFRNYKWQAASSSSASWNLSLLKRCFAPSNLADTFKTGQQAQS